MGHVELCVHCLTALTFPVLYKEGGDNIEAEVEDSLGVCGEAVDAGDARAEDVSWMGVGGGSDCPADAT